jgi:DMSO/TMAO reductase YedYZ molybdopterin-dependent catalytic subunit
MSGNFISRGFSGKRRQPDVAGRVPPGQHVTTDFPVLSAGPTPHTPLDRWTFSIEGLVAPVRWTWEQFLRLPAQAFTADIHCVTSWSKLDTRWEGVSLDTIFELAPPAPEARYVMVHCDGGYTTNIPLEDLTGGKAFVAYRYDGAPLAPEHGGPARLVVPHLYFWKSAKWVRGLELMAHDKRGFWEELGYHNRGDPWKEQRYSGSDDDGADR